MKIISNQETSAAFFTVVLFVTAWYHIKKTKQQLDRQKND
ncbi:hypothetical protein Desaci_3710 [Desulfosporosinus acidiphilus SJ4]|uniref:Uncharacterized protein n=1 Tax=Desulfosporosinus acidiphilus (strain DSM 22704 / JCM 16185 / SJ4) TaxID=646529 RepID=I4D9W7_DESAJ|nr:hypothetical protein Desaci_3710 [Desulfosporosinus acidiphilus SJ4]